MAQKILLNENAKQEFTINLNNYGNVVLVFNYIPIFFGWYLMSYTYQEKTVYINKRLTLNFSMFNQYSNLLPFNLCCLSNDGIEPVFLDDFISQRVGLFLTTKDENSQIVETFY